MLMKLTGFFGFLLVIGNQVLLAQSPTVSLGNPGSTVCDYYFRPETKPTFQTPPMRIPPGRSGNLSLASSGEYRTVIRSWYDNAQYIDNPIGWFDFHRFHRDQPVGVVEFILVSEAQSRVENYTVIKHVYEERVAQNGVRYTVAVPVPECRTKTVKYLVKKFRPTARLPSGERIDASQYLRVN